MKHRILLMIAGGLLWAGCAHPRNPTACANQTRASCGPGYYCDDDGRTSKCLPVQSARDKCGQERWPGECTEAARDAGSDKPARTDDRGGDDGPEGESPIDGPIPDAGVDSQSEADSVAAEMPPPPRPEPRPFGERCDFSSECSGGNCIDGVCCQQSSCPECQNCGSGGSCVNVLRYETDASCGGMRMCNGEGQCKLANGERCPISELGAGDGSACASEWCEGYNGGPPICVCGEYSSRCCPGNTCLATYSSTPGGYKCYRSGFCYYPGLPDP